MTEGIRAEAQGAWRDAGVSRQLPPWPARLLLASVAAVGATTVSLLAIRLAAALDAPLFLALGAALGLGLLAGPAVAWRRAVRDANEVLERTRRTRAVHACPRCRAPLLARDESEHGERDCGRCGGRLLEAEGLVIAAASDPQVRAARWRGRARRRFAHAATPRALSAAGWLAATSSCAGLLLAIGALSAPPGVLRAPLGSVEEVPYEHPSREGRAAARAGASSVALGRPTRPLAPLLVGTQVLASPRADAPYLQLAVVVRARGGRAFVVFADGSSDWVSRHAIRAPELAQGDAIEVWDGARHRAARIVERVGPALRVEGLETEWTSASRARVRVDATHAEGEGRLSDIPPGAWVDVRDAEAWRPGLAVESTRGRLRIALSDGSERWVDEDRVRAQQLGPGARVFIDGQPGTWIIAARIGHALAVVGPRGEHAWTSLSRVRRR